jgi:adenylate kinase family enzyme
VRSDDRADVVVNRLAIYDREIGPVAEYYRNRGILMTLNGEAGSDAVVTAINQGLSGAPTP